MNKRSRFNPRKFYSRVTGLTLLVLLTVMSFLSISGTLTADALVEPVTYEYQVESGDTLWDIAKRIQTSGQDVREVVFQITVLNNLTSSDIHSGQLILLPQEVSNEL
mgnify:CR=1 FL=1